MHLNVNSLRCRRTEVEQYLYDTSPDLVCFNETKLRGTVPPRIAGYRCVCVRDRVADRVGGGGVAIYARLGIHCSDVSPDTDDMCAAEFKCGQYSYCVVAYYCPPTRGLDLDTVRLGEFIQRYDRVVFTGDFNAKHQYFGSRSTDYRGECLFDFVERHDLFVANNPDEPTRHEVTSGLVDLIDYCVVTKTLTRQVTHCYVGEDVGSDHFPVHLRLRFATCIKEIPVRDVRMVAKCDWQLFCTEVLKDGGPQAVVSRSEADLDQWCETFETRVRSAYETACPVVRVKEYAFRVSPDTLRLIREKRKLRRKSQRDGLYRTAYNNISRQVAAAVRRERTTAWERATESLNGRFEGHKFWKKFKTLTGAGAKPRPTPRLVDSVGALTSGSEAAAELFAESLKSIHSTHEGPEFCPLARVEIERTVADHSASFETTFRDERDETETPMTDEVGLEELQGALRQCRNRSTPGPDGLSYVVLKKLPQAALESLAAFYSVCLRCGYFPRRWKEAHAVMLAKPGKDPKVTTSYRPISLLCTLGKLFERVITRRLTIFLQERNFINRWQQAYQESKEASEILFRLGDEIRATKNSGPPRWVTAGFSLDVEKAFDSVWHDGLRCKLLDLGLPSRTLSLFSSFLTGRSVQVKVDGRLSQPVVLEAGTPQGSVLSPILFLIYVNDIPLEPAINCRAGQFADDMNVWTSSRRVGMARIRLQRALRSIEEWCSRWRIRLNVSKTQLVNFRQGGSMELELFGEKVESVNEMKVLGIRFDQLGNLTAHCKEKAEKGYKKLRLLRMVSGQSWGANKETILRLYQQYVRPSLEYGAVVTAGACRAAIYRLELVERAAMRIAVHPPPRTRITSLYDQTGLQPLPERLAMLRESTVARIGSTPGVQELEALCALLPRRQD